MRNRMAVAFLITIQAVYGEVDVEKREALLQPVSPDELVMSESPVVYDRSTSRPALRMPVDEPSNPIRHMSEWNPFHPRFALAQPWLLGIPFQTKGFPLDGESKDKTFPLELLEQSVDEIVAFCPAAAGQSKRVQELLHTQQDIFNSKPIFSYRLAFKRGDIQYQVLGSPGRFTSFVAIWRDAPHDIPGHILSLLRPQDADVVRDWVKKQDFERREADYHYETPSLAVRVGWRGSKKARPTTQPVPFFGIRVVHALPASQPTP